MPAMMDWLPLCSASAACAHAVLAHVTRFSSDEAVGARAAGEALGHVIATCALVAGAWARPEQLAIVPAAAAAMLWTYATYVRGKVPAPQDLSGRVFIITGANTGIGAETAIQVLRMGATVVFACRSEERARRAMERAVAESGADSGRAIFIQCDLSSRESVRRCAEQFKETGLPLHVLVNNAGLMMDGRKTAADGTELTMAANHYGHFLLTNLLLDALRASSGRVVVVSSALHHKPTSAVAFRRTVRGEQPYSLFGYYAASKLANVLFAFELHRRMVEEGKGGVPAVTVNALHPGNVMTEVTRNMPAWLRYGHFLARPVLATILKQPPMGAYTSVYAATAPEVEGRGGAYMVHCSPAPTSALSRDRELASWLWDHSAKVTGL